MIKVNELRIGNLLTWKGKGVCKVISVSQTRFKVVTPKAKHPDQDEYDQIEPISLTPEWLERCGFEYLPFSTDISMFSFYKKSETFELIIVNDGINCEYKHGVFYYEDEHHPFAHLHQLQNLYFALSGEELQIRMP